MSSETNRAVIDVSPAGDVGPPAHAVNAGHAIYACYAVGFFIGITWLVGIIIAYVKRDDGKGTWMESHFSWQIRTFWGAFAWLVLALFLFVTVIGIPFAFLIIVATGLWVLYRIIRGWLALNDGRPV